MIKNNSTSAIYTTHTDAEDAIKELQLSGFDMRQLSIIGRDYHTEEQVIGYFNVGERMQVWGKTGVFWGGIWGLLFGSAFFWIPGLGPLLVAGPLVGWIVGGLEEALVVGGLSAIGASLSKSGIPMSSAVKYETAIKAGKFLLIAHSVPGNITRAMEILSRTKSELSEYHQ